MTKNTGDVNCRKDALMKKIHKSKSLIVLKGNLGKFPIFTAHLKIYIFQYPVIKEYLYEKLMQLFIYSSENILTLQSCSVLKLCWRCLWRSAMCCCTLVVKQQMIHPRSEVVNYEWLKNIMKQIEFQTTKRNRRCFHILNNLYLFSVYFLNPFFFCKHSASRWSLHGFNLLIVS